MSTKNFTVRQEGGLQDLANGGCNLVVGVFTSESPAVLQELCERMQALVAEVFQRNLLIESCASIRAHSMGVVDPGHASNMQELCGAVAGHIEDEIAETACPPQGSAMGVFGGTRH
jgi:hypothetical protein